MLKKKDSIGWLSDLGSLESISTMDYRSEVMSANAHIHLPPNFSAFKDISQAVSLAYEEKTAVLGINNYYNYSVYDGFQETARKYGIFPLFGTEIIVLDHSLANKNIQVNDPKNPGKIYLCGKAITQFDALSDQAGKILNEIVRNDSARMSEMVKKINNYLNQSGIPLNLTDERIIESIADKYSVPKETVCLQERHVAQAFQQEIFKEISANKRKELLTQVFGTEPKGDLDDPVQMQNEIRNHLMKKGKPGYVDETFVDLRKACDLILQLGGIPCYPVLADGTSPITPFEKDPQELSDQLRERKLYAAEFIPTRNSSEVLIKYAAALRKNGVILTAGTEHNSQSLIPIAPSCKDVPLSEELQSLFWEGTCVMIAHQYLTAQEQPGYVTIDGELNPRYTDAEERIEAFKILGQKIITRFQVTTKI